MPESLECALELLAHAPEGSRLIAGGTDLLPWAREGRAGDVALPMLVDITRVSELDGFEPEGEKIRLGANLVFQKFLEEKSLGNSLPCMPFCAVWFADDQIREQATLVGNLVNASPAADGTSAMLALNGIVETARLDGGKVFRRQVSVDEFVMGPGRTALNSDEIVTGVLCDDLQGYGGAFEKVGHRRSLAISTVCAACLVKPSEDGRTFDDVRLAMAGIGPTPVRLIRSEMFLKGNEISARAIASASEMTAGLVKSRTRKEYRSHVVKGFIGRAIANALENLGIRLPEMEREDRAYA
ncbi:MAG: FAD binding domain-containing protein [Albidovulum sp.]|nr:FAD binding domain-containing protein [Albidovulum sp.]MDE0306122.1 FAD binding domain-containing protein [Albidovulum sp.]MDE0531830.1 FAD binding domain-containing protein [Albidovulum sp.]